jgi:hypothetical protein
MSFVQTINTLELPVNPAARAGIPDWMISASEWSASPAGLTDGVDGALTTAVPDATIQVRTDCANAATPLP